MSERQMTVRRVRDATGSYIEPAFDDRWDDLAQLEWHAAVVTEDTGLYVRVSPSDTTRRVLGVSFPVPGLYCVQVGSSSVASMSFERTWTYLNGVIAGAEAANGGEGG